MQTDAILKFLAMAEGDAISPPAELIAMGLPADIVRAHVRTTTDHPFDASGQAVAGIIGVRHLDLLWAIAETVSANTGKTNLIYGRKAAARALVSAIKAKLGDQT